jgi:hypothetical protein
MAIIRHNQFRHPVGPPRVPHLEQLALHAIVLTLAVLVVLLTVVG